MKFYKVIPLSMCAVMAMAAESANKMPNDIEVVYKRSTGDADVAVKQISSSDTASLLADAPGVSISSGGGFSNIPAVHGLADDRLKITVDGMALTATCPNHMNTPLSYIDPKRVETVAVVAGIAPVSMGGDNIGGVIAVESKKPQFAEKGKVLTGGELTGFFRSNSVNRGALLSLMGANDSWSVSYTGSSEKASDYKDGNNQKIKATLYEQRNQFVTIAHKGENGVLTAQVGQQTIPYQGYVNEYMDMLSDKASFVNLSYLGYIGDKTLDAKAFWKKSKHYMNKIASERTGNMPMWTDGLEFGYDVKLDIPLSSQHTLKIGNDFHKYTLNDWWPAVSATPGGMAPNTFWNINNGHRDIAGLFAESNYKWSDKLVTNMGIRADVVKMNTGSVQGYNTLTNGMANDPVDAAAFNARNHAKQDVNIGLTATAQYKKSDTNDFEFGFARKVRSPNIHERYTWAGGYGGPLVNAPVRMDMAMVNWFGDGNGYVGNIDIKPEAAHTVSVSSSWHDVKNKEWSIKITPYYTFVKDYIDADKIYNYHDVNATNTSGFGHVNMLRFANHDAILFGADVSANVAVWNSDAAGKGVFKIVAGYTRGYRTDGSGSSLYHMMPLHAKMSLEQEVGSWTNGIDAQAVAKKESVDTNRLEPTTPGYTLVDIRTNYKWSKLVKLDFAITNLFDKYYYLPLGGRNLVGLDNTTYAHSSANAALRSSPLSGQGRSFNTAVNIKF